MNIEGIKSQLTEYFNDGNIKFVSFLDATKRIFAMISHPELNVVDAVNINITPKENSVLFELSANNRSILTIEDTYDNELGIAYTQWFTPILRNIVNNKYELKGEPTGDALTGTNYCQIWDDGMLLYLNLTEMIEFTNQT